MADEIVPAVPDDDVMTLRSTPILAAAMAVVLVVSSCGSDDDGGVAATTTPRAAQTPSTTVENGSETAASDAELLELVMASWRIDHPDAATSAFSIVISRPDAEPVVATSGTSLGADISPADWFRLGSVTKTYVATALLRLVDEGRLDLDAPISTYLPAPIGSADLSTRELLTHTSGLADYLENPAWIESIRSDQDRVWTTADILDLVDDTFAVPGVFAYSNTNYIVAGQVLQAVSGQSVRGAVDSLVLSPAGLVDTDMAGDGHPIVDATIDLGDGTFVGTGQLDAYTAIETSAGSAGSISATPSDLARFGRLLLDGQLLDDPTFVEMTSTDADQPYGLGLASWADLGETRLGGYGNYGEIPGYGAMLLLDPDTGVVLVATSADDRASAYDLGVFLQRAVDDGEITPSAAPDETDPDDTDQDTDPVAATEALFGGIDPGGPGCAVAVNQGGEIVFSRAWGSATVDPPTLLRPDSIFDVGSLTKQFTATAVLLLSEQGLIDLDAPLSTYLTELPTWGDVVTVDQAIHHTSGIADYIEVLLDGGADLQDPVDTAAAYVALADTELSITPGTAFSYSNSNYLILASIIEAVSGSTFAEFIEADLLGPAGVDGHVDPTGMLDGAATSYARDGEGWTPLESRWTQVGDGGLQTTPADLAQWGSQYWNPTVGGPDLVAARFAGPVVTGEADDEVYGAGIRLAEVDGIGPVISHIGSWEAFISTFLVAPTQQVAVVASCNAVELAPVRDGVGLELLRIWSATP